MSAYEQTKEDLVVNRMTRQVYDQLSRSGQIRQNEIYFVEEPAIDASEKQVANSGVRPPTVRMLLYYSTGR